MADRVRKPEAAEGARAPKTCAACGRTMVWRKAWARNWADIKFCSDACRSRRGSVLDRKLEEAILRLLESRGRDKTICPSEAARTVVGEVREHWAPLMEPARAAARRLVAQGRIDILQSGHVVDGSTAKGPIRLRLR